MDTEARRGADVSVALTDVRTIHSRAKTAYKDIESRRKIAQARPDIAWMQEWNDPDVDDMLADLADVIAKLDRWRRTPG